MTAAAIPYRRPFNPMPLMLAALLALAVVWGVHAVAKHGDDAATIRQCLDDTGPELIYRFTSERRRNQAILACRLPDGRWGIAILERVWYGLRDRSAYVVKDGTWQQLWEYLSGKGVIPGPMP